MRFPLWHAPRLLARTLDKGARSVERASDTRPTTWTLDRWARTRSLERTLSLRCTTMHESEMYTTGSAQQNNRQNPRKAIPFSCDLITGAHSQAASDSHRLWPPAGQRRPRQRFGQRGRGQRFGQRRPGQRDVFSAMRKQRRRGQQSFCRTKHPAGRSIPLPDGQTESCLCKSRT